ncbi:Multidrug resistance-associated protein 4, partial [Allomyces arbusculus]
MSETDDVTVPLLLDTEADVGVTNLTPVIKHERGFSPSDLVFLQASPLVEKGFWQGQLEHNDLLPIRDADQSEVLATKMREAWNNHLFSGMTPSMWRVLVTVFGRHYLTIAVLAAGSGMCKISSAIFLGHFISFLQTPDAPLEQGVGFGAGLAMAMLTFSILESHFMMNAYRIGIRARVAITAFLYSHLLTLNGATLPPVGQTLNVISNDAQKVEDAAPFLIFLVLGPIETCVVVAVTWIYMGWAAAAAFGTLFAMLLLVSTNMERFKVARGNMVDARDRRMRLLSELIKSIEMIKLYAWESAFVRLVLDARREEVAHLRKWYDLKGLNTAFTWTVPGAMAVAGFFAWFFGVGTTFTTEGVFTSLLLFGSVRVNMSWRVPRSMELVADLRVSFQRIEEFMNLKATAAVTPLNQTDEETNTVLAFNSATFAWTPNQPILRDVDLTIRAGQIVAVIGQVGSGKSSLLLAALGQLHTNRTDAVRRVTDVAYTPQAAYVFPGTVEDNIVMASPVDADRLARVVAVCQLTPDIARWDNGLQTRLGERGVKVSGGQRARLCLARALYHADATQARLVVLDNVFAALDAHVADTIFTELREFFKVSGAAVVIVTHHLHLVAQCDEVVYLHSGSVLAHGPLAQVVTVAAERDPHFAAVVAEFTGVGVHGVGDEKLDMIVNEGGAGPSRPIDNDDYEEQDGGLIGGGESEDWDEHAQQGFDASMFWDFLKLSKGAGLMIGALVMGVATFALQALADYKLSTWAAAPAERQAEPEYWVPYLSLTAGIPFAAFLFTFGFFRVLMRSSAHLFEKMLHNVDMALADETLPDAFTECVRLWLYIFMIVIVVAIAVPWILLALAPVIFAFFLLRRRYVAANR